MKTNGDIIKIRDVICIFIYKCLNNFWLIKKKNNLIKNQSIYLNKLNLKFFIIYKTIMIEY